MTQKQLINAFCIFAFLVACEDPRPQGWRNQPIPIRLHENLPLVDIEFNGKGPLVAAIDSSAPVTVVSTYARSPNDHIISHSDGELRLQDGEHPEVTRFIFFEQSAFDLRLDKIGVTDPIAVDALIGFGVLSYFAVHLSYDPVRPTLIFRDSIPDTNAEIASDCDTEHLLIGTSPTTPCVAVVPISLVGGGGAEIAGEPIDLPASRLVVPVCLLPTVVDPKSKPADITPTGVGSAALVATGMSESIIARSAFKRLQAINPTLTETEGGTLHLPYGTEDVSMTTIAGVAVVANATHAIGPCGELARRQRLLMATRDGIIEQDVEQNGASVAQLTAPTTFAILDDDAQFFHALRNELRPNTPDVDLVLGGSVLKNFEVDLDYPGRRVLLECSSSLGTESCRVLPFCFHAAEENPSCR